MDNENKIEQPKLTEEMQTGLEAMVDWSGSLVIVDDQQRTTAIEGLKRVKSHCKKIKEWFKPSKDASHKAWKTIVAQEKEVTNVLDDVEKKAKAVIVTYDDAQKKLRKAEQARLQAAADKTARLERERLLREAAKLKTPELREERMEQAEEVVAPIIQAPVIEKAKGASTRKVWNARVVDTGLIPREYMLVNEKALNAMAKATKGAVKIAGVEFYSESQLAVRV
jgi:hypothetical protein